MDLRNWIFLRYFRYGAKQRNDCVFSSNCLDEKESEESDLKSGILGEIFAFPSLACHFSLTKQVIRGKRNYFLSLQ